MAQNSVLNGRLVRECGFDRVHIPHCVGDEGIAIGCAIYGAHLLAMERQEKEEKDEKGSSSTRFFKEAPLVPPYLGKRYSAEEVILLNSIFVSTVRPYPTIHTLRNELPVSAFLSC